MSTYYLKNSILIFAAGLWLVACNAKKTGSRKEPPSSQSNPLKETELNTITLTPKAAERLGIQTTAISAAEVGNHRMFSGEIIAVPGRTITVTAPVAGTLLPASGNIAAGQQLRKGQPLYRLLILPSEKDLISAQEDVAQRQVQYSTSLEKVKRTTRMYEEKSGSLRARQEAEAELAGISAQLNVAKGRVQLLRGNPSAATSRLSTLNMQAPISGTVLNIYTSPSQVLTAGAAIMDIVALNSVWVKVPLYAGDEGRIQKGGDAAVYPLSGSPATAVVAKAVSGPQTSNPQATSIDLYYEMDNTTGNFRPGQKVSVTLPFTGTSQGNIIPFSAVVYDINGGTWVYTNPSPNVFVRQRVELQLVKGREAVLNRGPVAGTRVVTVGAAELFGTEFGGGK